MHTLRPTRPFRKDSNLPCVGHRHHGDGCTRLAVSFRVWLDVWSEPYLVSVELYRFLCKKPAATRTQSLAHREAIVMRVFLLGKTDSNISIHIPIATKQKALLS